MDDSSNFILEASLIDARFSGSKFTWSYKMDGLMRKCARLDRVLINVVWGSQFPNLEISYLPNTETNHNPLLISCKVYHHLSGLKPFLFRKMWTLHNNFKDFVRLQWSTSGFSPFHVV